MLEILGVLMLFIFFTAVGMLLSIIASYATGRIKEMSVTPTVMFWTILMALSATAAILIWTRAIIGIVQTR